ncbi:ABC transporter ATP-binding protein [Sporolactobacillus sp. STSJ-5]|uniref:ABC transporter ATP-binding protein n=1 Tax=Sporolactobacillus sp. STSJ-5 TaxID=2965076 RepID=UPI0021029038|nr:ABC transporter ATP-binding protein [Sporolactobacillus sp. STSJ-5]MCQ2009964.1 ABC transporter ATP-binding protein [Sporolactobacillus sp. STSJ-5]
MDDLLLDVRNLKAYFKTNKRTVKAVDDLSFTLKRGEILGLVGESGCGKSTTTQALLRLIGYRKNEHLEGEAFFEGEDLIQKSDKQMQKIRGNKIGFIAQNPMSSLNPVYTIGNQIAEVPQIHQRTSKNKAWSIALKMLQKVGIPDHETRAKQFSHQFSGGMKQRAVIAMALADNPSLLIADEPTTALDVTIQAQILDLMVKLRDDTQAGILLITHDLGVVAEICDRVAVMYAGKIVEQAPVAALFNNPLHPYTKGLLASIPKIGSRKKLIPISGHPPNLYEQNAGCLFKDRCPFAFDRCQQVYPDLHRSAEDHHVACHLHSEGMNSI